jgi:hypothetical protein
LSYLGNHIKLQVVLDTFCNHVKAQARAEYKRGQPNDFNYCAFGSGYVGNGMDG